MHINDNEKAVEIFKEAEAWGEKVTINTFICDYRLKYAIANYRLKDRKQGNKNADLAFKLAEE
ncbi:MAG: hypothetical protein K6E85_10400 [Lachnospiraceae bacterium]|nr:hypothetical protein [Lachnospiraceae bacterium]